MPYIDRLKRRERKWMREMILYCKQYGELLQSDEMPIDEVDGYVFYERVQVYLLPDDGDGKAIVTIHEIQDYDSPELYITADEIEVEAKLAEYRKD